MNKKSNQLPEDLILQVITTYKQPQTIAATAKLCHTTERIVAKVLDSRGVVRHSKELQRMLCLHAREEGCLKKYGVKNVFAATEIKEKIKKTCLDRYGAEYAGQSEAVREKITETCLKKYGVSSPFDSTDVKNKIAKTNIERYGAENPFASAEIKEKIKQTNLERYGVENPFSAEEVKNKIMATCLDRYGVEHMLQSQAAQDKFKNTCMEHFGVDNPSKNTEIKNKKKQTLFDNFGIMHVPCTQFWANDQRFDSFPELCFYLYHTANNISILREPTEFEFSYDNKIYKYYPDFKVVDSLYELKGDHFLKEDGTWQNPFDHDLDELFEAKRQCALKNNVQILYQKDYQKYVDWFFEQGYKKEDFLLYNNTDNTANLKGNK